MPKFFVDKEFINDHEIILTGDNARHISTVLRLQKKDEITVCDGEGFDYICNIEGFENGKVITRVVDMVSSSSEPDLYVTLYQALPKADKMEFIIQKSIEVGVSRIVPVMTEHCIVKLDGKEDKKIARWNKIAEAAAKQSGRGMIPEVVKPLKYVNAVKEAVDNNDISLIPYEKEKDKSLKSIFRDKTYKNVSVFIGPEGGFSRDEIELAKNAGVMPITLGKRILRTETAGIVCIVQMMYEREL